MGKLSGDVKSPHSVQSLIRSRLSRLALAFTLLALSAWAFWPYVAYRVAPSAFVNAELVRVTSPMSGRLAAELPRKGWFFDHPTTVTLVTSLAPDRRPSSRSGTATCVCQGACRARTKATCGNCGCRQ